MNTEDKKMKVLVISGDPGVADPNTRAGERMVWYREILGEADVLLCRANIFSFAAGFFRGLKMMRGGYDVITAQDQEHAFLAWIFSIIYGVPWQMQIHTDIMSPYFKNQSLKNKLRVALAKFLIPRAGGIRVVSERIKRSVFRYVKATDKVMVLPIFVDVEYIRTYTIKTDLRKKYPGKFVILMASRITAEKNIGLAIEAFKAAMSLGLEKPSAENAPLLLIVGDGPEKPALERKVRALNLGDSVKFEPATGDIISYYKTCGLFLATSNYEGYGMTLVEAASAGAPIISADAGIAPEILEPENIFKPGDSESLREKLESAFAGRIKPAKNIVHGSKNEYLRIFKESLERCL